MPRTNLPLLSMMAKQETAIIGVDNHGQIIPDRSDNCSDATPTNQGNRDALDLSYRSRIRERCR